MVWGVLCAASSPRSGREVVYGVEHNRGAALSGEVARNQRSTRLSPDEEVGVECSWNRGVFVEPGPSHALVVWVA